MTTDAGSGFDHQAAGRDTGDDRLEEESRHLLGQQDAGDEADEVLEEARERQRSHENVNDAF
jgi:hypothetical protein